MFDIQQSYLFATKFIFNDAQLSNWRPTGENAQILEFASQWDLVQASGDNLEPLSIIKDYII